MRGRSLSTAVAELQTGTQHRVLSVPELPSVGADRDAVLGVVLDQPRGVVGSRRARSDIVLVLAPPTPTLAAGCGMFSTHQQSLSLSFSRSASLL